jgi:hypothetical protein
MIGLTPEWLENAALIILFIDQAVNFGFAFTKKRG